MSVEPTRALRIAGAILVVLTATWAGFRVASARLAAHAVPQPAALQVPAGEASPPTASDLGPEEGLAQGVTIPEQLPAFSLRDRNGKATPIATWGGKSLILNFWATWCPPCRREIPLLKSLYGEWGGRNVEVVGIAVDYRDKVSAYADELKIPYPLLVGEQDALDVAARLGVDSPVFPFTVFTDKRGEVVALYVGELHRAQADLILGVVQNLNDDAVKLPEARRTIAAGLHALAPLGELRRRSPPKLAISAPFLVIIADLFNATTLDRRVNGANSAPQRR